MRFTWDSLKICLRRAPALAHRVVAISRAMIPVAITGAGLRTGGLVLLALAVSTSSLTFNWVVEHHPEANLFPEFTGRVIYLSDIPLLAGLVLWAVGWLLTPDRPTEYGPRYVFLPLLLLVLMTAVSVVWAANGTLAGFTAIRRMLLLGLYLAMVNDFHRALAPMVVALSAAAILHSGVALAQLAKGSSVGLPLLGEIGAIGAGQVYGLGFNPNPTGLFLAVVSTLGYGLFLCKDGGWKVRALTLIPFLIPLAGLVATSSRAALMGWSLGVLAVTLLAWLWSGQVRPLVIRRAGAVVLLLLLSGGAYGLLAPTGGDRDGTARSWSDLMRVGVLDRLSPRAMSDGLKGRAADLGLAGPIILEHPYLGVGAGNYPAALKQRLNPAAHGGIYTPPHNVLVLILAELGLVGATAWVWIMAAPLVWLLTLRGCPPADLRSLLWLGPLVVVLVGGLWDFPTWATQDGRVLFMAVLGMWAGGVGAARPPSLGRPPAPRQTALQTDETPVA